MKSKNKPAMTRLEREHVERVARVGCVACDAVPVEVHEPAQGLWFASIALCPACHRGPAGWHGTRLRMLPRKLDELTMINETLRRVAVLRD